jgi:hypothetical protein
MQVLSNLFDEMSSAARMANAVRSVRKPVLAVRSAADDRDASSDLLGSTPATDSGMLAASVSLSGLKLERKVGRMAVSA